MCWFNLQYPGLTSKFYEMYADFLPKSTPAIRSIHLGITSIPGQFAVINFMP